MSQNRATARSHFRHLAKKSLLPSLLLLELLLIVSLRWKGWDATLFSVRWLGALLAAALPLMIAALVLFRSSFQFRLKALLVAFALMAIFLGVSVAPVLRYSQQRRASVRLQHLGVELHMENNLIDFDTERVTPFASVEAPTLTGWLTPLVGNLTTVPLDDHIKCVSVTNDDQLKELSTRLARLPNLNQVTLHGPKITDSGFESLVDDSHLLAALTIASTSISADGLLRVSGCRRLNYLLLQNTHLPDTYFRSLPQTVRSLFLWAEGDKASQYQLRPVHLRDIGRMHQLETLMIAGYNLTDQDTEPLSGLGSLRHLVLRNTLVTRRGEEKLTATLSSCRVARGSHTPSAASIDRQFGIAPDAAVLRGLTLIERRFMTLLQSGANDSRLPRAIWEHPKLPVLFDDLTAAGYVTDESISELRAMCHFRTLVTGRATLRVDNGSPDFEQWAEVIKDVLVGLDRAIDEIRMETRG